AAAPAAGDTDAASTGSVSIFERDPVESLAQALRDKQRELDEREKEMNRTEQRLLTLRKEIELNLAAIEARLKQMEEIAGKADKNRQTEISKWIEIYQSMAPEQAGKVFDGLDPAFALELLSEMEPKKAGKILGYVQTDKAIELGKALKERRL
ncbi:MAG: hypothetical protein M1457_07635, partial [bacterium]|nr:hypothetical protein [bacterium]